MRKSIFILLLTGMAIGLTAHTKETINGIWFGTLKVQGMELRLAFTVSGAEEGNLSSIMTSIDQGNTQVPMEETTLKGDILLVKHADLYLEVKGKVDLDKGTWDCEFIQGTVEVPLLLEKVETLPGTS